jgi:metabolite-proton symporter|tara:strand:- start:761 stop:2023 length:1263 start_codon:yes stop_codon:yes gene_type:complete
MSKKNSPAKVLFASLAGTTIEFFDFYIYANAAVLVFPTLFFHASNPNTEMLQSLATFSIAFFARPLGSAFFGHFGDRIGRKTTLVAALLTMGISTVAIGLLPTYHTVGILAPILLIICRFGQGFGLGGEWGGAVLLAVENAPPEKKAWYGMFPQLGAPIGLVLSGGIFLYLSNTLTDQQFFDYGWRIPFLLSSVLIIIGLYVRLSISETPEFEANKKKNNTLAIPFMTVFKEHGKPLFLGTFIALATFVLFYLMTVFIASWAITDLHMTRELFLENQITSVAFFALLIPISAVLADRYGRKRILMTASMLIIIFGILLGYLLGSSDSVSILITLSIGMALMGFTYGPLGTILSELYPTNVRYTGSSLSFNLAGIVGASFAPFIALWLSSTYGIAYVGYYLALAALISLVSIKLSSQAKAG